MSVERKRSLAIAGHRTSVSLEEPFWAGLKEIAAKDGRTLAALVAEIDSGREGVNLSSALRLHVLAHYQRLAATAPAQQAENAINQRLERVSGITSGSA